MHANGPRSMLSKTEALVACDIGHAGRTGDSATANLFRMSISLFIPRTNNSNGSSSFYNPASSNKRESNLFFNTLYFVYLNMSMSRGYEDGDNNKDLMIML